MKYITGPVRIISLIAGGVLFGFLTLAMYLFGVTTPWAWAMIFGALTAMGVASVLGYLNYRENVKFSEARSRVEGTVLEASLATVCNFGKNRRAYVFLTSEHMRLFLWDKRPYLEATIRRDEVTITYSTARPNYLTFVYEDKDTLELVFPNACSLVGAMRENGYHVEEEHEYV